MLQGPQLSTAVNTLATNNTSGLLQQLRNSGALPGLQPHSWLPYSPTLLYHAGISTQCRRIKVNGSCLNISIKGLQ